MAIHNRLIIHKQSYFGCTYDPRKSGHFGGRVTKQQRCKCRIVSIPLLVKPPTPSQGGSIINSSDPNHLPKAVHLNTTVGFLFPFYDTAQWKLNKREFLEMTIWNHSMQSPTPKFMSFAQYTLRSRCHIPVVTTVAYNILPELDLNHFFESLWNTLLSLTTLTRTPKANYEFHFVLIFPFACAKGKGRKVPSEENRSAILSQFRPTCYKRLSSSLFG